MNRNLAILLLVLLVSCSSEEKSRSDDLINAEYHNAIYSTHVFKTDELKLDTIRVAFGDGHSISHYPPVYSDEARMHMYYDYEFDFEKDSSCFRTILNYELRGDSIRYYERKELPVVEKRTIETSKGDFEILKVSWWFLSKADDPNMATFISKEFGQVAQLTRSESQTLRSLGRNKESQKELNEMMELLTNSNEFYTLKKN